MPPKRKDERTFKFDEIIGQIDAKITFNGRETIQSFMRQAIEEVLREIKNNGDRKISFGRLKFRLVSTIRDKTKVILDVLIKNGKSDKRIVSIPIGSDTYNGLPDCTEKISAKDKLPPLVPRQMIYIDGYKKGDSAMWNKMHQNSDIFQATFKLDCQIERGEKS